MRRMTAYSILILALMAGVTACGETPPGNGRAAAGKRSLFIVGFAVPGEAIQKGIAPAFARKWAAEHGGERIDFQFSFGGSSVQSRNVANGLEADLVYLSDWPDVERLATAGLVDPDWNEGGRGIVSQSVVIFQVAPGNPKGIRDWADLLKPGIRVLTPNPRTSGAARWNILAAYGAFLKTGGTAERAEQDLRSLYRNVINFGESGRATTQDFKRGLGDVAITYENEVLLKRKENPDATFVIPGSTIMIENPAAVVRANARKHGVEDVAEAFHAYLRSAEAQKILVEYGFRSIDPEIARRNAEKFPTPPHLFDVGLFGGWPEILRNFFDDGAL